MIDYILLEELNKKKRILNEARQNSLISIEKYSDEVQKIEDKAAEMFQTETRVKEPELRSEVEWSLIRSHIKLSDTVEEMINELQQSDSVIFRKPANLKEGEKNILVFKKLKILKGYHCNVYLWDKVNFCDFYVELKDCNLRSRATALGSLGKNHKIEDCKIRGVEFTPKTPDYFKRYFLCKIQKVACSAEDIHD